jgi:hypothetical protein
MDAPDYQQCLDKLNLSHANISVLLGCAVQLSKMWSRGERSIPPAVAEWLLECLYIRNTHPYPAPPEDWRRNRSGGGRHQDNATW